MTWFRAFVKQHTARHQHPRWPAPGEERQAFFGRWKDEFARRHVTEAEAARASKEFKCPGWPREHLDALVAHIKLQRAASGQSAGGCGDCGGMGLGYDDAGRAAYCHCRKGQWIKNTHLTSEDSAIATRFGQMKESPVQDDAAIDALWADLDDDQRAMWRRETAQRFPHAARGRGVWLESMARSNAYAAEVLGVDPFEAELEVA